MGFTLQARSHVGSAGVALLLVARVARHPNKSWRQRISPLGDGFGNHPSWPHGRASVDRQPGTMT